MLRIYKTRAGGREALQNIFKHFTHNQTTHVRNAPHHAVLSNTMTHQCACFSSAEPPDGLAPLWVEDMAFEYDGHSLTLYDQRRTPVATISREEFAQLTHRELDVFAHELRHSNYGAMCELLSVLHPQYLRLWPCTRRDVNVMPRAMTMVLQQPPCALHSPKLHEKMHASRPVEPPSALFCRLLTLGICVALLLYALDRFCVLVFGFTPLF